MKLLFDENLSPDLVRRLTDLFPDSVHVRDVDLAATDTWACGTTTGRPVCHRFQG